MCINRVLYPPERKDTEKGWRTDEVMPQRGPLAKDAETVYPGACLVAYLPMTASQEEKKTYSHYVLEMHKHTDTAINIVLKKVRWDRTVEVCEMTLGFSKLCNRIFVREYYKSEVYP